MTRPSPSPPCGRGPSLSRNAGEGLAEQARFLPLARIAGEGGERSEPGEGLGAERRENRFEHAFGAGEDIVVPESNDSPAMARQPFGAAVIGGVLAVLASICFDDEPLLSAGKVDDERSNGMLPPEAIAGEASRTQVSPQTDLGIRGCTSEVAGEAYRHGMHRSTDTVTGRTRSETLTRFASLTTLSRSAGEGVYVHA
jgi:hypothetical protein